jgi:hypothetical protein
MEAIMTYMAIDEGWYELVEHLENDLRRMGWKGKVLQVKEKLGGLRYYIDKGNDAVQERIRQAENESYRICEVCGGSGELRRNRGWLKTLCETHNEDSMHK